MSNELGIDRSGNGNNWTVNNMAFADQVVDSPTNNFCTWNSADNYSCPLSEGNLKTTSLAGYNMVFGTQPFSSGKYYWEQLVVSSTVSLAGVANTSVSVAKRTRNVGDSADSAGYDRQGRFFYNDVTESGYATFGNGDIIGIACNMSAKTVTWYKNNTFIRTMTFSAWDDMVPAWTVGSGVAGNSDVCNFGQDSSFAGNKTAQGNQDGNDIGDFYYTPPTGFLALCTKNLPDVAVVPSEHFNTVLWTGNDTARTINGVGFQPDFSWIRNRDIATHHLLFDAIRGAGNALRSNSTNAESTGATDELTAFAADGLTLGTGEDVNGNAEGIVAWNWKAGTAFSNDASATSIGNVDSSGQVNTNAGFSIVSWQYTTSADNLIAHGLSVAPEMIILKSRTTAYNWDVYHKDLSAVTKRLLLNTTSAEVNGFFDTAPTSTVFEYNTSGASNNDNMIAYCFHSVDGYSKVGSYTGNGNADGTFVYTGFKVAFIAVKKTDAAENWVMIDNKRHPINDVNTPRLYPNLSNSEDEDSAVYVDYVSNGFKIRATQNMMNNNASNYIYIAFAETPFKYSNAR